MNNEYHASSVFELCAHDSTHMRKNGIKQMFFRILLFSLGGSNCKACFSTLSLSLLFIESHYKQTVSDLTAEQTDTGIPSTLHFFPTRRVRGCEGRQEHAPSRCPAIFLSLRHRVSNRLQVLILIHHSRQIPSQGFLSFVLSGSMSMAMRSFFLIAMLCTAYGAMPADLVGSWTYTTTESDGESDPNKLANS